MADDRHPSGSVLGQSLVCHIRVLIHLRGMMPVPSPVGRLPLWPTAGASSRSLEIPNRACATSNRPAGSGPRLC